VAFAVAFPCTLSAAPPPVSFADIVERVAPAVVNISTTKAIARGQMPDMPFPEPPPGSPFEDFFREFFDQERAPEQMPRRQSSLGSGFVVDPDGFVVTNNHVIAEADEIQVVFNDETTYEATLVGRDTKTDLALLKIEPDHPLAAVTFADSDTVRVGDWIIAIGNPFGLGSTVTAGIVSARSRDIRAGPYDDFLQVDAPINRGNSGGPLFDARGRVIGINAQIRSQSGNGEGVGFAVPINAAKRSMKQLIETGRVAYSYVGVTTEDLTPSIAREFGDSVQRGAVIANVTPGSPGADAGLRGATERRFFRGESVSRGGDVVVAIDGRPVRTADDLVRIIAERLTPGDTATFTIVRGGERRQIRVHLGERPTRPRA
jgi:serine protease Do